MATDEVLLNAGPHHFSVRLIEPQRGGRYTQSVRARAEVELPEGEPLERVEFYLNETLMATLYQPPFVQPIAIPPKQELAYVRAVAYLDDGSSTEDLVFVNSPDPLDEVQVDFVELYTSVFDSKGHPVDSGLALEDFVVEEDGIAADHPALRAGGRAPDPRRHPARHLDLDARLDRRGREGGAAVLPVGGAAPRTAPA